MNEKVVYIPMLRAKEGELKALRYLAPDVKSCTLPLLDIPPPDAGYKDTIIVYLTKTIVKISRLWDGEFILDVSNLDPQLQIEGRHFLEWIFDQLNDKGLNFSLCVGPDRDENYRRTLGVLINAGSISTIFVRVQKEDILAADDLPSELESFVNELGIPQESCGLILDLKHIPDRELDGLVEILTTVLPDCNLSDWRLVAIAGSSIPADMSEMEIEEENRVQRNELIVWESLKRIEPMLGVGITYGDYHHKQSTRHQPSYLQGRTIR